ncbi:uncharacterized protein P884DRAFT_229496 [Thermothelomyces heterothallicus CBS 202.75]|uniref:uncharacterized protein n=1 Tax=Thermothelomyces heterothallicus CBS 202.75 TaxID=1149848 RepID=UPI003743ED0B
MYLAYKYAKKRYKERQAREAEQQTPAARTASAGRDGAPWDEARGLTAYSDGPGLPAPYDPSPLAAHDETELEETADDRAEKKRRRTYRLKIILGLFLPFALQALDTTIIASALKFIAEDFHELKQLNWIITAFNLTSAAFLPIFAQLADTLGRHATLQTALVVITVGSALCTGSPTSAFPVLLLGRALQGVGAAGVNISVRTILADRVSLAEYAKNWTTFAIVSGVSFGLGPVAGGYLTQISWRWCFAINLPVGVAGIALVALLLRKELVGPLAIEDVLRTAGGDGVAGDGTAGYAGRRRDPGTGIGRFLLRLGTLDYGGQVLFLFGFGLLILGFTWAGGTYAWGSAPVVATLAVGGVLAVAWAAYEWAMAPGRAAARAFPMQKAMMPWRLLTHKDVGLLLGINFASGAAMFAIMYFMDLYFTLVKGHSSSEAGIALLYYLPGLGVGVYANMFFMNVRPRQTLPSLMLGTTCSAVGISVVAWACHTDYTNLIYGMMALTGFGVGLTINPGTLHALAYVPGMTAAISCLSAFCIPFGGSITLTIMTTVFNNRSGPDHQDPRTGIVWAFISVMPIMWLAVLITTFLGNVWLGKDGNHELVREVWFWNTLRGRRLERVKVARMEDAGAVGSKGDINMDVVRQHGVMPKTDVEQGRQNRASAW